MSSGSGDREMVTDDTFGEIVLRSDLPVLVDFTASWCAPCAEMEPVVDRLAAEFAGKVRVVRADTAKCMDTCAEYGILGVPTYALFRDGSLSGGHVGAVPAELLRDLVSETDPAEEDCPRSFTSSSQD